VLQASLAGARLALLLDHAQHLPFDLIERLPLQSCCSGNTCCPNWRRWLPTPCWPASSSARELGIALYLDDPFNLQDAAQWQDRGVAGRW
jgi:hypothetical protein